MESIELYARCVHLLEMTREKEQKKQQRERQMNNPKQILYILYNGRKNRGRNK